MKSKTSLFIQTSVCPLAPSLHNTRKKYYLAGSDLRALFLRLFT